MLLYMAGVDTLNNKGFDDLIRKVKLFPGQKKCNTFQQSTMKKKISFGITLQNKTKNVY